LTNESQEPLRDILNFYDIKVSNIRNETYKDKKGVWWIDTDKGLKVLKKISNSEQTLKYIISTIRHLKQNGINLAPINKTKAGADYVNINNNCYILTEAIKGKNPSYDSEKELILIIKELAKFHVASKGFKVLPDTKPKIHLGSWIQDYTKQLEDMNYFYHKEVSTQENNIIGKYIIEEFPYFYNRGEIALESLKGPEYNNWVKKVTETNSLCHQDFAAGNLILNSQMSMYVLDTDSITIDIPARDIRKILLKVMKRIGKWDLELTKKILKEYQNENPLETNEWKVVLYDLMFPHLFLGAMNKFYYQRDAEWTTEKYFKRIKEMSEFEKTLEPIINKFETLIPI
jgi:CotS family spore coat protein